MAVERSNTGHVYGDYTGYFGFYKAKMCNLQLCGVHNKIHLYPKTLDIDIIYVNKGVESESDFSVLFQIMDFKLVNSLKTNFRFIKGELINPQQSLSIGQILKIEILYLQVKKINIIVLEIPSNSSYYIYDGPLIGTNFQVKEFGRSVKLLSFQCTILSKINTNNYLIYNARKRDISSLITIREDVVTSVQLPVLKCQYRYGQYCILKVRSLSVFLIDTQYYIVQYFWS